MALSKLDVARCRHPGCVVASDVRMNRDQASAGPFVYCDVQDKDNLARIILENGITTVVHLATLLSGSKPSTGPFNVWNAPVRAVPPQYRAVLSTLIAGLSVLGNNALLMRAHELSLSQQLLESGTLSLLSRSTHMGSR